MKASQLIAEAKKWIGYCGKKNSTDNLNVFDSPNGIGEYNCFSRDCYNAGYFNGNKNGYDGWCTSFVVAMFLYQAGSKVEADKVCPTNANSAGCDYFAGVFTARKIDGFVPKVGDVGFVLDTDGSSQHCFLVASIDSVNMTMTTIEGNTKDENGNDNLVCQKIRTLIGKTGSGPKYYFGHPYYEDEEVNKVSDEQIIKYEEQIAKYKEEIVQTKSECDNIKLQNEQLINKIDKFASALKDFLN